MLLTKVLRSVCETRKTIEMTRENCKGFKVYEPSHFYAITYLTFQDALNNDPEIVKKMFKIIENSTLIHMSNKFSKDYIIETHIAHAYGILADMYCPKVFHSLAFYF